MSDGEKGGGRADRRKSERGGKRGEEEKKRGKEEKMCVEGER